tara:strand:- start:25888 stop:26160 length:273 start_codon:yes stop_codon:yes gene_type:complete
MKNQIRALVVVSVLASGSVQAAEQFDRGTCASIKGAVELFLALADAKFKEQESLRNNDAIAAADEAFKVAAAFSDLVENYATAYAAFCKP